VRLHQSASIPTVIEAIVNIATAHFNIPAKQCTPQEPYAEQRCIQIVCVIRTADWNKVRSTTITLRDDCLISLLKKASAHEEQKHYTSLPEYREISNDFNIWKASEDARFARSLKSGCITLHELRPNDKSINSSANVITIPESSKCPEKASSGANIHSNIESDTDVWNEVDSDDEKIRLGPNVGDAAASMDLAAGICLFLKKRPQML
jgi:hypothetical protein